MLGALFPNTAGERAAPYLEKAADSTLGSLACIRALCGNKGALDAQWAVGEPICRAELTPGRLQLG